MRAFTFERVKISRQRSNESFTFACFHLRDFAAVENHAAAQLDIKGALTQNAPCGFSDRGEGFGEEVVQSLSSLQAGAKFVCLSAELFIR